MVGETGFEPATLWSQTRCATKLRYSPTELKKRLIFKPEFLCKTLVSLEKWQLNDLWPKSQKDIEKKLIF